MPIKFPTLTDITQNLNVPGGGVLKDQVTGPTMTGVVPGLNNVGQAQTAGSKPILGPLSSLEINKYKSASSLQYPLDIGSFKHYVRFNINIAQGSKYSKSLSSGVGTGAANWNGVVNGGATNPNAKLISGGGATFAAGVLSASGAAAGIAEGVKDRSAIGALLGGIGGAAGGVLSGFVLNSLTASRKTKRIAQSIFLYVPDTVQSTMVATWDSISMTEAMGNAGFLAEGGEAVGTAIKELVAGRDVQGGGGKKGGDGFLAEAKGSLAEKTGNFGAGIKELGLRDAGLAMNPRIEILFKAINNREFQFDFKFTPTSQKEALQVLQIIKAFRFHAAPELLEGDSSRYLIPPSEFDIEYCFDGKQNPALNKISSCVLEGVDVNYVGAGQFAAFADGMPVEIGMQLRFKEVEIMHKALIDEGY